MQSVKAIFRTIFAPLLDYIEAMARAGNPKEASNYILSLEGRPEIATKFMIGSVFLTSASDLIIPGSGGLSVSSSSVVNDLILLLMFFLSGLITAVLAYKPLKWMGGSAKFSNTLMASVFITTVYFPIISIIGAVFSLLLDDNNAQNYANYGIIGPTIIILAGVHRLSFGRASLAVIGSSLVFAVVAVPALISYENYTKNQPPDKDWVTEQLEDMIENEWHKRAELREAKIKEVRLNYDGYSAKNGHSYTGVVAAVLGYQKVENLIVDLSYKDGRMSWKLANINH